MAEDDVRSEPQAEIAGMREVEIDIDGSGMMRIRFVSGRNRGIRFGPRSQGAIKIDDCTTTLFKAGQCTHLTLTMTVSEGADPEFLSVIVTTDANCSMNFRPKGLRGYHVNPNTVNGSVLSYNREERLAIREATQKELELVSAEESNSGSKQ